MKKGKSNKKIYNVYHYMYGKLCSVGIYKDIEDNVKSFVDILNDSNHSFYPNLEDYIDEGNYYAYIEIKPMTVYESLSNAIDTTIKNAFDKIRIK